MKKRKNIFGLLLGALVYAGFAASNSPFIGLFIAVAVAQLTRMYIEKIFPYKTEIKNDKNRNYQPIIYSLILIIGIVLGNKLVNNSQGKIYNSKAKVNAILQLIEDNYVDELNPEEFEEKVDKLNNERAWPSLCITFLKRILAFHGGRIWKEVLVGLVLSLILLRIPLVVITPISGGPSEKLGIKSGDRIVEVEDENIAGIGIDNNGVIDRLRGEKEFQSKC